MTTINSPTIYATLMREAIEDARGNDGGFRMNGLDEDLEKYVAPCHLGVVRHAVSHALFLAYRRGVEHGYTQAAVAFDATVVADPETTA